jgi:IstB-like ATP binding protein
LDLQQAVRALGEVFGDATVAAAMIDRLVHHAEVVNKGDNYETATGSRTKTSGECLTTTLGDHLAGVVSFQPGEV